MTTISAVRVSFWRSGVFGIAGLLVSIVPWLALAAIYVFNPG